MRPRRYRPDMASTTRASHCVHFTATKPHSRSSRARKAVQSRRCGCRIVNCVRSPTMKQVKWKALIADDEPVARRGVRQLLANFPEFAVAGECRKGAGVVAAL